MRTTTLYRTAGRQYIRQGNRSRRDDRVALRRFLARDTRNQLAEL